MRLNVKSLKYFVAVGLLLSAAIYGFLYFKSKNTLSVAGEVKIVMDSIQKPRAVITFQLKQPLEVYVKYWLREDEGKAMYSPVSPKGSEHSIQLIGLKGEKQYEFKIVEALRSGKGRESTIGIFSAPKISSLRLHLLWTQKRKTGFPGYILSQRSLNIRRSTKGGENNGYLFLTDSAGEAIWFQEVPGLPKLSHWSERNTFLVISGNPMQERSAGDHIYEYDLHGNELTKLDLNSIENPIEAHHEIRYSHDGNLLTLIYDKRMIDFSSKNGKRNQEVKGDGIVKLSKEGKILWKWSVFDVLDPVKSQFKIDSLGEWGHANTLSIDRDGNYLISFRDWNQIWKVNATDGSLIWRLGENGDFELPADFSFSGQHSIHINPRGEYMMLDNGVKNKKSRVLCFNLDEVNKKIAVRLNVPLPEFLYSEKRGSAYYMNDENILICAAESSALAIIDEAGNILARADTGLPDYYRAVYIPQLYSPERAGH